MFLELVAVPAAEREGAVCRRVQEVGREPAHRRPVDVHGQLLEDGVERQQEGGYGRATVSAAAVAVVAHVLEKGIAED